MIHCLHLSFDVQSATGERSRVLHDLCLDVPAGAAVLFVGANGAGKSTLLRVLAGKHLPNDRESVTVLGQQPFFQTLGRGISHLGNSMWTRSVAFVGSSVVYEADIAAGDVMREEQQVTHRERRDELVDLLEIDLGWRMHQVSDGQRRRVQIMLGLMAPFQVLLMDEITVDLDVLVRRDLLAYLKRDCERRSATVVYATHIFDGLDGWPTHLLHICDGRLASFGPLALPPSTRLHDFIVLLLLEERERRRAAGKLPAESNAASKQNEATFGSASGYVAGRNFGIQRMAAYR